MLTWKRVTGGYYSVYESTCGKYKVEKYESLLRGVRSWVLTGAAGERTLPTLRDAKWEAERHARKAAKT